MSKKLCIIANGLLLMWFFFDVFGFSIGKFVFVEAAWNSIDGIWFLFFAGLFAMFCVKDKYGKYPLSIFLLIWAFVQFTSHWYYTIFGASEERIAGYNRFFGNTYFIVPASDSRIIPDFYHIVLYLFILFALSCMVMYCIKPKKNNPI
ncbi:MAG: hypothetical protein FWH16_03625 [Oscillospiraceae bacterium]|nr:hypothetical protein [Oscillospiraceae bacterium]